MSKFFSAIENITFTQMKPRISANEHFLAPRFLRISANEMQPEIAVSIRLNPQELNRLFFPARNRIHAVETEYATRRQFSPATRTILSNEPLRNRNAF